MTPEKTTKPQSITGSRIIGYDFARALAVFGMVIVNFKIVMGAAETGSDWLRWLAGLLDGRAAATFVILAGVGISLLSQRGRLSSDTAVLAQNRRSLLKRALFLFVVGLLYTPIWPADILHFYGIYIAIAAFLLAVPDKRLWQLAALFTAVFVTFMFLFDYEAGWNWQTLAYADFWTASGMVRHLFFNGFHPVFPWTAFLLAGMWLGRQDMRQPKIQRQLLWLGGTALVLGEALSTLLTRWFPGELGAALFGTAPMPPMPLYLLSGGGAAFIVIALSVVLTEKWGEAAWIRPFVVTGQLALTIYVAHVIIGMGTLEVLGMLENQTLGTAVISAFIFYGTAVLFATLWRAQFKRGPLEWVMRRITQ